MNKCLLLILSLYLSVSLPAQQSFSNESFSQKVLKSFKAGAGIILHDSPGKVFYTDTAFHLPAPLYKTAIVTPGKEGNDTLFFYRYPADKLASVITTVIKSGFSKSKSAYSSAMPLTDSSGNFFIFYCFPESFDSLQIKNLRTSLTASFGVISVELTLVDVKQDTTNRHMPPPPPPPPRLWSAVTF